MLDSTRHMEEELITPEVTVDMLPTQAMEESHSEHGSVVPAGVDKIHDGD